MVPLRVSRGVAFLCVTPRSDLRGFWPRSPAGTWGQNPLQFKGRYARARDPLTFIVDACPAQARGRIARCRPRRALSAPRVLVRGPWLVGTGLRCVTFVVLTSGVYLGDRFSIPQTVSSSCYLRDNSTLPGQLEEREWSLKRRAGPLPKLRTQRTQRAPPFPSCCRDASPLARDPLRQRLACAGEIRCPAHAMSALRVSQGQSVPSGLHVRPGVSGGYPLPNGSLLRRQIPRGAVAGARLLPPRQDADRVRIPTHGRWRPLHTRASQLALCGWT